MPVFTLRDPTSGTILHINAPDAATAQQGAQHWAQQNAGYVKARAAAQSNIQRNNAGWGDVGRTIRAAGQGASFSLVDDLAGGINAGLTGIQNFAAQHGVGQPAGYSMADAYKGIVDADRDDEKSFDARRPVTSTAAKVGGAVVSSIPTGAAGFVRAAPTLLGKALRAGVVGGAQGAVTGFGSQPGVSPVDRLPGTAEGAAGGAVLGAAAEPVIAGAGALVNGGLKAGAGVAQNVGRMAGVLAPERVAAQRLAAALKKDPQDIVAGAASWPGASTPTVADLAGENVRSTVRNAASQGPARNIAQGYRDGVAADLQDNALNLTGRLTPGDPRTADQAVSDILDTRQQNARTNYAGPYSQTVNITPGVVSALRDPEGHAAVTRAIAGARGLQDYGTVSDLERLADAAKMPSLPGQIDVSPYYTNATAAPPLTPTTGRALDAIQQAFGRTGRTLQDREGSADLAAGLFMRQGKINDALDSFDELGPARADYKNLSAQAEAVDHGGSGTSMPPDTYASTLASILSKGSDDAAGNDIQGAAGIGYRQALANILGAPTEGATGAINRIATSTNQGENLTATFGPDAADAYRSGLGAEADRMVNANYMAPNTASQTMSKSQDAGGFHFNPIKLAGSMLGFVKDGPPLSDAEREAIVNMGLSTDTDPLTQALLRSQAMKIDPSLLQGYAPVAVNAAAQSPQ